jgi:phosphatidate phosphatase APP1
MRALVSLAARGLVFVVAGVGASSLQAGEPRQAHIVVYDGWGSPEGFRLSGRVLKDRGDAPGPTSILENVAATLDDLESDEVRRVDVIVRVGDSAYTATTDGDGVFVVVCKGLKGPAVLAVGAIDVEVEMASTDWTATPAKARVHILHGDGIAVVSDIDDTVVKTYVVDRLKMATTVLTKNAHQLEPVVGAARAYEAAKEAGAVAFFYVSGSPQNLHLRLRTFLDDHAFPRGPLLLKNLGEDAVFAHDGYKQQRLERLAADFPRLRFVLVGDSGERDPEIYRAFQAAHRDRVVAIVIRKVPGSRHLDASRFSGFIVVDDAYPDTQTIASLLTASQTSTTASHASADAPSSLTDP